MVEFHEAYKAYYKTTVFELEVENSSCYLASEWKYEFSCWSFFVLYFCSEWT